MFFLFFLFYTVFLTASLIENDYNYFECSQLKKVKTGKFFENIKLKKIITFHEFYLDFDYHDEKIDDKNNISKYGYYVKKQIAQTVEFYERIDKNISEKNRKKLQNYLLFLSKEIVRDSSNRHFSLLALSPLYCITKKDNEFKKKVADFVGLIVYEQNKRGPLLKSVQIKIQISDYMKKIEDKNINKMIKNIDKNNFYRNNPGENPQQKLIDLYKKILKELIPKKPLDNSSNNRNSILEKIKKIHCPLDYYAYQYPKNFLQSLKKQVEKSCNEIENCLNNGEDLNQLDKRIDSLMNAVNKKEKTVLLCMQELELDKVNLFTNNYQVVNAQYDIENIEWYSSPDKNIIYCKDENNDIYSVSKNEIKRDVLLELINCVKNKYPLKIKGSSFFWSRFFGYTLTFSLPTFIFFLSCHIKRNPEQEDIKRIYKLPIIGYLYGTMSMVFLYLFFPQIKLDFYSLMS